MKIISNGHFVKLVSSRIGYFEKRSLRLELTSLKGHFEIDHFLDKSLRGNYFANSVNSRKVTSQNVSLQKSIITKLRNFEKMETYQKGSFQNLGHF